MHRIDDSNEAANKPVDPSTETPDTRPPEERSLTLFTEIADGIRSLDLRMGILATRFEHLERDMLGAVEHLEHEINGTLPPRARTRRARRRWWISPPRRRGSR